MFPVQIPLLNHHSKKGTIQAKGLNAGIMYLLVMPYLLVGGIGYYWYANQRNQGSNREEET